MSDFYFGLGHNLQSKIFKSPDSLERNQYRPLVLDWLTRRYKLSSFRHSYSDNWLNFSVWDGSVSVILDLRNKEQEELFNALPKEIKGTPRKGDGKLVNINTLYFKIEDITDVIYPTIIKSEIIDTELYGKQEPYLSYTLHHHLSDNTILVGTSQDVDEKFTENDYIFRAMIQLRAFLKHIST